MTPLLQSALIFITLVLLAVIVYTRLVRYEAHMREEKEGVHRLNDRLQSLVDGLGALGTRRLEDQLAQIQELLERIHDQMSRRSTGVSMPLPDRSSERQSRGSGPIDIIEAKLYNLGYSRVTVVSDLAAADLSEPTRVVVEAEKEGVTHKGHLVIYGTSVTELEMQPSYTSFP